MASREYCSSMAEELGVWSEKLHKLSSEIDRIPSIDKYRLLPQIEDLHIIMTELDDRLCAMNSSCSMVEGQRELGGYRYSVPTTIHSGQNELFDYDFGG